MYREKTQSFAHRSKKNLAMRHTVSLGRELGFIKMSVLLKHNANQILTTLQTKAAVKFVGQISRNIK